MYDAVNTIRLYGEVQDLELLRRLSVLMLEGTGSYPVSLDSTHQYNAIRRHLIANPEYKNVLPDWLLQGVDLRSAQAIAHRRHRDAKLNRTQLTEDMAPAMKLARELHAAASPGPAEVQEETEDLPPAPSVDSSAWTGISGRTERLIAARNLLPTARLAIEDLIAGLSASGHNGGPLLDDVDEAIDNLRQLHRVLGEILTALDKGSFGQGLPAEAVHWGKRAWEKLNSDPIPYAVGSLLMAIFSALGFPGAGAFVASCAVSLRKD